MVTVDEERLCNQAIAAGDVFHELNEEGMI